MSMTYPTLKKLFRENWQRKIDDRGTISPEIDALLKTLSPLLDPRVPTFLEGFSQIIALWGQGDEPLEKYKGLFMDLLNAQIEAKEK